MFSIHILTKGHLHLELAEYAFSLRNGGIAKPVPGGAAPTWTLAACAFGSEYAGGDGDPDGSPWTAVVQHI